MAAAGSPTTGRPSVSRHRRAECHDSASRDRSAGIHSSRSHRSSVQSSVTIACVTVEAAQNAPADATASSTEASRVALAPTR